MAKLYYRTFLVFTSVACTLLFSFSSTTAIGPGQPAPDFTLLNVPADTSVKLTSFAANHKAVVLVFFAHNCPFAAHYTDRLKKLKMDYQAKGVTFLLVNPHTAKDPAESKAAMINFARQKSLNMAYLADGTQAVSKQYAVTKVPETFILKSDGKSFTVAYRGAIDDNPQVSTDVSDEYLRVALNQVLNNQTVSPGIQMPEGCMVRYGL